MTIIDAKDRFFIKQALDATKVEELFTEEQLMEAYRTCRKASEQSHLEYMSRMCDMLDEIINNTRSTK